jgi:hypothetical protein
LRRVGRVVMVGAFLRGWFGEVAQQVPVVRAVLPVGSLMPIALLRPEVVFSTW